MNVDLLIPEVTRLANELGLDVVPSFKAADDTTVDDEIELSTADGRKWPVGIQIGNDYLSANLYDFDEQGEIQGMTPGKLRRSVASVVRDAMKFVVQAEPALLPLAAPTP